MRIKTMLLASVAAAAAASGARAADAPVTIVEPEPVEYVRVCDVYGKAFFYIPGTETCLRIGGYVRMRVQANDEQYNSGSTNLDSDGPFDDDYAMSTRVRGRLEIDAREETDLGTLRSYIRLQATNVSGSADGYGTSSNDTTVDQAYVQLGGLFFGKHDSLWTANVGGIEDGLLLDEYDFAAGDFSVNRIAYTATAGGFSGTLSLEDDGDGDAVPDVVGKLAYKGKWGAAYLQGVYDEDAFDTSNDRRGDLDGGGRAVYRLGSNEFGTEDGKDGAFAIKGGILLSDLLAEKSILKFEGHYAFDPTIYARVDDIGRVNVGRGANDFNQPSFTSVNGGNMTFPSEWQVGAAYRQDIGKFFVIANGIYGQTFELGESRRIPTPVTGFTDVGSIDYWGIGGDIGYKVTSNFTVKGEVSYVDLDLPSRVDDFDQTRGFLEFRRDF